MSSLDHIAEPEEPLQLLTVTEAAHVLRVGRSLAYRMAHEYLNSGGTAGMPVVRFGRSCLRVPRWALLELAATGRVVQLRDEAAPKDGAAVAR